MSISGQCVAILADLHSPMVQYYLLTSILYSTLLTPVTYMLPCRP